jgi:hypothetical protein
VFHNRTVPRPSLTARTSPWALSTADAWPPAGAGDSGVPVIGAEDWWKRAGFDN